MLSHLAASRERNKRTMSLGEILIIALALAIDAFTVALAGGVTMQSVDPRRTLRLAWHFGLFQTLMTILGWSAGLSVRSFFEDWDHWLAMGLLAFVGGRMIYNSLTAKEGDPCTTDCTKGSTLVMLSLATSIDALAVGIGVENQHLGAGVDHRHYGLRVDRDRHAIGTAGQRLFARRPVGGIGRRGRADRHRVAHFIRPWRDVIPRPDDS
jgi:putative Mn2+ efflux pump MntP